TAVLGLISSPYALTILLLIPIVGYLFAALGMAYALGIPAIDFFSFYWTCFLSPLFLFSDTFFPLAERLPGWAVHFAEATPILHCVRLARALCFGTFPPGLWWDAAYLAVLLPITHYLAARAFLYRLHRPAR
ncbi:MAG: hypothetical protein HY543_04130, partial [Deltaproteobacteria bacterium]|nr:hypothetical protein [Deltaproteobacteria bacterium]